MLDLRIHTQGAVLPVYDLPAVLGREGAAREIGDQIEALLAFIDDLSGDPDLEDGNDTEADDERELSYSEWHTRTRAGTYEMGKTDGADDDEDDDEDACEAADDGTGPLVDPWSGRTIWGRDDGSDLEIGSWPEQVEQGGLTEYPDDDREDDLRDARKAYIRRARLRRASAANDR